MTLVGVQNLIFSLFVASSVLQVKVSLDSLMENLTSLSDIGDCVARVEYLLKELKSLEEKAQVGLIWKASLEHRLMETPTVL